MVNKWSINILSCWNYQGKIIEFVSPNWAGTMFIADRVYWHVVNWIFSCEKIACRAQLQSIWLVSFFYSKALPILFPFRVAHNVTGMETHSSWSAWCVREVCTALSQFETFSCAMHVQEQEPDCRGEHTRHTEAFHMSCLKMARSIKNIGGVDWLDNESIHNDSIACPVWV